MAAPLWRLLIVLVGCCRRSLKALITAGELWCAVVGRRCPQGRITDNGVGIATSAR
jgi:hypothetical protein